MRLGLTGKTKGMNSLTTKQEGIKRHRKWMWMEGKNRTQRDKTDAGTQGRQEHPGITAETATMNRTKQETKNLGKI